MARVRVSSHVRDARFRAAMRQLPRDMRAGARAGLNDSAEQVADDMRRNAPMLSGTLRSSIAADVDRRAMEADIGPGAAADEYDQYVEFGTSKMNAQPFVGPAGERCRATFPATVARHVRARVT